LVAFSSSLFLLYILQILIVGEHRSGVVEGAEVDRVGK
jgi:hypothetical protein